MSFPKPCIIGQSSAINKIMDITKKVSDVDLNVLITGESGVGKELVARSLHFYSKRVQNPFVKVNCAALPSELIEAELFGFEKGSFTGAEKKKPGKFEVAERGSVFLDEIGELPLNLQAKLLQVLHDKRYYRIGGNKELKVEARIIAATNQNLEEEIHNGNFRDDLYYRLSTISINIPPLRERKEDIPDLLKNFIKKIKNDYKLNSIKLPEDLIKRFQEYHWPGNIREMENFLNRACILHNFSELEHEMHCNMQRIKNFAGPHIYLENNPADPESIPSIDPEPAADTDSFPSLREVRDQAIKKVEKEVIEKTLQRTNWNRKEAARTLLISYRALLYKIKELQLKPPAK